MSDKLYKKYLDQIQNQLKFGEKRGTIRKSASSAGGTIGSINQEVGDHQKKIDDKALFESLSPLTAITGKKPKYYEKPGAHPDFINIKSGNVYEFHYITSMFIDIKNSTGLFKKYRPETVANILTTIQNAAIHTCWYYDGYVQRLNGDGLMIYFGGRNMTIKESVNNALTAASLFCHFMENDLKQLFNEQNVEDIFTRIGIDTGEGETVLWHLAGMGDCSEITTCSLHTSLAAKLQARAASNGSMVGDNVKYHTSFSSDLFAIKKDKEGKEERYIFQIQDENFNYTQWQFNTKNHFQEQFQNLDQVPAPDLPISPTIIPAKNLSYLKEEVKDYKPYFL